MDINLYCIGAETDEGVNRDLMVLAASVERAARHWVDYFELSPDEAESCDPRIWLLIPACDLQQEDLEEGTLSWENSQTLPIPSTIPEARD